MLNNPYRKAVNIGGSVVGLATLIATGVAASQTDRARVDLNAAPNYGLHDGQFRVETECIDAQFCPIRTLGIDVRSGQIANIDVGYHDVNRQSHARNSRTVNILTDDALRAQSADNLDLITGATVTSLMFQNSLQQAINMARH